MMHHGYDHGFVGFHLAGMLILAAFLVIPFWKMLPRAGIPGWIAFFAAFPPAALVLLWVVAFRDEKSAEKAE